MRHASFAIVTYRYGSPEDGRALPGHMPRPGLKDMGVTS